MNILYFLIGGISLLIGYSITKEKDLLNSAFYGAKIGGIGDNVNTIQKAKDLVKLREGVHNPVSRDSLGLLTAGIGHRVLPRENFVDGQHLNDKEINTLFEKDFNIAYGNALKQSANLGITDSDFISTLASVNFQLGSSWFLIHKKTWSLLLSKKYYLASKEVKNSLWHKQTPVRTNDFSLAIRNIV